MPDLLPRYTVDDLDSFPNDGKRYELLDGVLLVSPAPLPPHEFVLMRIRDQLTSYLGGRAWVCTHGAVQVRPKNHLEPDLLVLPGAVPIPADWGQIRGHWLAVEVSGRGSRVHDRDTKPAGYVALGVAEIWRADLRDHAIEVIQSGVAGVAVLRDRLVWRAPGFDSDLVLDIPAVFAGIRDHT